MTRQEALAIRQAQLNGVPVTALELREAVEKLKAPRGNNRKYTLPTLSRPDQERIDAILCFNLGRAIGRAA